MPRIGVAFVLFALAAVFSSAPAQDYPSKPIRIVVPYPPGGGMADRMARMLADKLQAKWGQAAIVDNRAGAAANIGAEYVYRSAADGYTLLFMEMGPLAVNKFLFAKLAYDPDAFVPVSVMVLSPNVLAVHPKVPAETLQQFIAYAKANPDKLNYASNGSGGAPHLTAELFKSAAGVRMTHVPYKGVPPALTDLLAGQVDVLFVGLATVIQHARAGKLRILAVGSEKRQAAVPDLPSLSEFFPGFATGSSFGMVAPPKTPMSIATRLSSTIAEAIRQPEVAKLLTDLSLDPVGANPAETARFIKQESERWGPLIRTLGVTMD